MQIMRFWTHAFFECVFRFYFSFAFCFEFYKFTKTQIVNAFFFFKTQPKSAFFCDIKGHFLTWFFEPFYFKLWYKRPTPEIWLLEFFFFFMIIFKTLNSTKMSGFYHKMYSICIFGSFLWFLNVNICYPFNLFVTWSYLCDARVLIFFFVFLYFLLYMYVYTYIYICI